MPEPITWYALGRTVSDPQTILEAIDEKILVHNQDPSAHGQSDEAIYWHRVSSLLDHVNYSIYNIKLNPLTRTIKAFVDADGTCEFTSIQDAINYVAALGGGKIFIKEGTYEQRSDLILYSNIELEGEDNDTTIIDFGGRPFRVKCFGTSTNRKRNIHFKNLQFVNSTASDLGVVAFDYVNDCSVKNCKFTNNFNEDDANGGDISFRFSRICVAENNYSIDSGTFVLINDSSGCFVKENMIIDSRYLTIISNGGNSVLVKDNFISGAEDLVIYITGNNVMVLNNMIVNCGYGGVYLTNACSYNQIIGNFISASVSRPFGICVVNNSSRNLMFNNLIVGPWEKGILVSSGNYNLVKGNLINSSSVGIFINTGVDRTIVLGNQLYGCGTGINNSGTNTEIGHNLP